LHEVLESDGHRGGDVEHVDSPAAPNLAVDQLSAERVLVPASRVDRYNVGMAHQAQARSRRVAPIDTSNERFAAWCAFEAFELDARPLQVVG